jgi:uncharacterized phage-associated protein
MAHRAVGIANEFLKLPNARETITQMQLQKLVYIAHGWNLAISGEPLTTELPEAWEYGPVYRNLYEHTKYFGSKPLGRFIAPEDSDLARFFGGHGKVDPTPYTATLTSQEQAIIAHVWSRYGALDAIRLSALTHQKGTPWFETFTKKGRNAPIANDLILSHYQMLAEHAKRESA